MFPPTPDHLADVADVRHPVGGASTGAAWLIVTASRAAEVQQQLAEGRNRDEVVTLHAHYALEDPHFDPCDVAADLELPLCRRAQAVAQPRCPDPGIAQPRTCRTEHRRRRPRADRRRPRPHRRDRTRRRHRRRGL